MRRIHHRLTFKRQHQPKQEALAADLVAAQRYESGKAAAYQRNGDGDFVERIFHEDQVAGAEKCEVDGAGGGNQGGHHQQHALKNVREDFSTGQSLGLHSEFALRYVAFSAWAWCAR